MKTRCTLLLVASLFWLTPSAFADPDPNFYVFLCFGQSNMDGAGRIEQQDRTVDGRFQVLATMDMPNMDRKKGQWYPAVPPLCRPTGGLGPADYFGRTMVANLPENIKVGVINVAIPGCKIELFEKDTFRTYAATAPSWMTGFIKGYNGNPYQTLVDMAKLAQKDGMIKGILLHQGESNPNDQQWPNKVKAIYDNLIQDLNLKTEDVPLLAGETVHADQQGVCAGMNKIIAKLPETLPNSYVISSAGCPHKGDRLHFSSAGYREFGKRYAEKMLLLLGHESDWRQQANERIKDIRQREAQIRVLDEEGRPVPGVNVEVKQTSKAFPFGAALSPTVLRDPKYQEFFLSHFNWAVFENEMKWYSNEGRRGREDYSRADAMLAWCQQHGIPVRGHCVFWEPERWQPRWLRDLDAGELHAAVEQRMDSIVRRYRGKVVHWDVNNEMLHGSFFKDRLGEGIHAWMFKRAHEIDPQSRLFVNDFNILSVDQNFTKTEVDEYVKQIRQLIDAGAPIHGVGIQGHVWFKDAMDHPEALKNNLDQVAELGLPIWITEFDSAFDDESVNAEALEAVYRTAYSHPSVEGIIMWVLWAGNSWIGPNAGLARLDWNLNAAGKRYAALMAEWSTNASGVTNADGVFAFRGFHGEYTVTVRGDSQQTAQKKWQLAPGKEPIVVPVTMKVRAVR